MTTGTNMSGNVADQKFMTQALELARQGQGAVEPNPMVGCVLVREGAVVGRGYHQRFGGPHAEVEALSDAGDAATGGDAYVTLEPCCHQGKTGPCTQALIKAKVARVFIGCEDPNPKVAGQGITTLRQAGIEVVPGVLEERSRRLIAPFSKLITTGRPWVIAKWAMTLDGKIASASGSSKWISGQTSREFVHELRGRVDAILVGRRTAALDNPLLTARPTGPRTATRVVLDSTASLSVDSNLVQSIDQAPLLVAATDQASVEKRKSLEDRGVEVLALGGEHRGQQLTALLEELGKRQLTNLLVEGGSEVLGALLDLRAIDEVHVFVAPKILGGAGAPSPIGGAGIDDMTKALSLCEVQITQSGEDVHVHGYSSSS